MHKVPAKAEAVRFFRRYRNRRIGDFLKDQTTLKAWYVDRLEGRSYADGWFDLDYDDGRLLGIAPEALSADNKKISQLEESVVGALSKKQAFEYQGTLYIPIQDKRVKLGKGK